MLRAVLDALIGGVHMGETSGAVMDAQTGQEERDAAEAERLAEEQAALDAEPSQEPVEGAQDPGPEDPEPEHADESQGPQLEAGGQLSLDVGGKKPTGGSLRLTGGKIDIPTGQFKKGQKVAVLVEASVDAIEFVDIKDPKTGQVVGCDRRHKARITSVALYDE
jgi:hypothetical protein